VTLVCLDCRSVLTASTAACVCAACARVYPIEHGVVRFVADDTFYEGRYTGESSASASGGLITRLKLYLNNSHYLWWIRKHIPAGGELLDLGVGGGTRFVAEHGRATAVDLSFASVRAAAPLYERAVQANALALPLAGGSIDAVVSSFFLEHVPVADKPAVLAELARVVRPGGRLVLIFDTESDSPAARWLRRDAERYHACIVARDGHVGLESVSTNLQRFRDAGFRVLDHHVANKTLVQHLPAYVWLGDYGHPVTTALGQAAAAIASRPWAWRAWTAGVTLLDDLMEPVLPDDWGRIMLVALEKP